MELLVWVLVALLLVCVFGGVGVAARRRQRRGGVIAAPPGRSEPGDDGR